MSDSNPGHLMLLDPVDGGRDVRFRLYGTLVAEISGMDMTGKLFSQFPASAHVVAFGIASTRAVLARAEPLYSTRKPMMAERTTRWQRLALPLADEGGAVARVVVATVAVGRSGEMLRKLRM